MVRLPYVKVHTLLHEKTKVRQEGAPLISPPRLHGDALCHSPSVASVHVKVLMSVWVKMLGSYSSQLVRTSCELTRTLSVRQRSAENTEKKKKKEEHKRGRKKRQVSELAQERK